MLPRTSMAAYGSRTKSSSGAPRAPPNRTTAGLAIIRVALLLVAAVSLSRRVHYETARDGASGASGSAVVLPTPSAKTLATTPIWGKLTAPDKIGEPRNVVDDSIKGWTIEVEGPRKAHATIESYVGSTGVFTVSAAGWDSGDDTAAIAPASGFKFKLSPTVDVCAAALFGCDAVLVNFEGSDEVRRRANSMNNFKQFRAGARCSVFLHKDVNVSSEAYLGDRLHADAGLMPECVLQATYGNLKDMMAVLATRNTRVFLILSSHGGITSAAEAAKLKESNLIFLDRGISKEQYARYKANDPDGHFQTTKRDGKTSYEHTYSAKGNRVIMGDIHVTKQEIKTDLFGPFCKNPRSNLLVLWSSCFSGGFFSSIYLTHADGTSEKVHKSASPDDVFGGDGVVYPDIAALEAKMARLEKVTIRGSNDGGVCHADSVAPPDKGYETKFGYAFCHASHCAPGKNVAVVTGSFPHRVQSSLATSSAKFGDGGVTEGGNGIHVAFRGVMKGCADNPTSGLTLGNNPNPATCAQVKDRFCKDKQWGEMVQASCPRSCGLCSAGDNQDLTLGSVKTKLIARLRDLEQEGHTHDLYKECTFTTVTVKCGADEVQVAGKGNEALLYTKTLNMQLTDESMPGSEPHSYTFNYCYFKVGELCDAVQKPLPAGDRETILLNKVQGLMWYPWVAGGGPDVKVEGLYPVHGLGCKLGRRGLEQLSPPGSFNMKNSFNPNHAQANGIDEKNMKKCLAMTKAAEGPELGFTLTKESTEDFGGSLTTHRSAEELLALQVRRNADDDFLEAGYPDACCNAHAYALGPAELAAAKQVAAACMARSLSGVQRWVQLGFQEASQCWTSYRTASRTFGSPSFEKEFGQWKTNIAQADSIVAAGAKFRMRARKSPAGLGRAQLDVLTKEKHEA